MRKKQQNLKKRPKDWYLRNSTSKFISSERKQVREYQQRSYRIM